MSFSNAKTNSINPNSFAGIMRSLRDSKYDFQLTGSYYFGNATSSSDVDFFVQCDRPIAQSELRQYLKSLGFVWVPNDAHLEYKDSLLSSLYRREGCAQERNIDIQIVKDFELKQHAQRLIVQYYRDFYIGLDKKSRSQFWNLMFMGKTGNIPDRDAHVWNNDSYYNKKCWNESEVLSQFI